MLVVADEVVERQPDHHEVILHVQRRLFHARFLNENSEVSMESSCLDADVAEDPMLLDDPVNAPSGHTSVGNALNSLLFQPIAGDAARKAAESHPDGLLQGLQFGMLDAETIHRLAVVTVTSAACTEQPGCLADLRMGASAVANRPCETCGETHHNCPGHFGRIQLPHAVINPLFVGLLATVLQTVCVHCQRLRLSPFYIQTVLPASGRLAGMRLLQRLKSITALCVRQMRCQFEANALYILIIAL